MNCIKTSKKIFLLISIVMLGSLIFPKTSDAAIDITTISYDSKSKSVNAQDPQPYGLFFKPDGTVMYVGGYSGCFVFQYSLSTAWDITTATYSGLNIDTSTPTGDCGTPSDMYIKSDGTELYFSSASKKVYQFTLSTPWNISTATYNNKFMSTASQENSWSDALFFKSDGTKMYVGGLGTDKIFQYSLATSWDVSTATYDNISFLVTGQLVNPIGLTINSDGTKAFIFGGSPSAYVNQYTFSTPWDLSTLTSDGINARYIFSNDISGINIQGGYINSDVTKLYVSSEVIDDTIYQYSFPDSTAPTVSTLSPTDNATDVPLDSNLVITFSEAVDVETGNITIKKSSDDSNVETIAVGSANIAGTGTTIITINPTNNLNYSTQYYVNLDATAFDDAASNSYAGIVDATTWSFTTESAPRSSSGGTTRYGCKDPKAVNYDYFSKHKSSLCKYEYTSAPFIDACKAGDLFSTATGFPCPAYSSPTLCIITITLKQGSTGEEVKCLQTKLNIISDGIFGPMTKASVIAFQKLHNLVPDGIVGPVTRGAL